MADGEPVVVEAQMLVRRPAAAVFEAMVDPAITTRFWFTRSSGRLAPGASIRWDWEMYGVGDVVEVRAYEENARLLLAWRDDPTTVEWRFEPRGADATLVRVVCSGFPGDCREALPQAMDAKGGYTMVLAGLKAWLEHGIELRLVADQFPDGVPG
jgi:uncharacterized protein YndB with AHSA1/START domain